MAVPDEQRYVMPSGDVTGGGPYAAEGTSPEVQTVEGARVLANDARQALCRQGLNDEEIDRLADEYAASHPGESEADPEAFRRWALSHR